MPLRIILISLTLLLAIPAFGQRKVTPVETDDKKPQKPRLHYYDKNGNALKEPVEFIVETDTAPKASARPKYPLLNGLTFGVNFFDGVMMLAGQKHASFDVSAEVSLHNWFFPVVEAGIGFAKTTPAAGNFTYTGKPGFYAKLGMNYNFLYKSNPDYLVYLGVRAGFSHFSYDITDITVNSDYWGQTSRFDILGQKATAVYGEVLAGVRVKIVKGFSLGWSGRYHVKFHTSAGTNSNPWFIPGYGTTSPISFTFSAFYTIPFPDRRPKPEAEAAAGEE